MEYDFDEVIDRRNSSSSKWSNLEEKLEVADLIPFSAADMDFRCAEPILQALRKRLEHPILGYTITKDREYLDAVKNWMKTRHGWDIDEKWLIYTPGVITAYSAAVQAYSHPGDQVIVQPPVFPSGIFRPEVTKPHGIDVPVIAWGLGLDRMAMVALGIHDIRDLFSADLDLIRSKRVKATI